MQTGQLTVEPRTHVGKTAIRKLRTAGKVPGICYGLQSAPVAIAFEEKALMNALDPIKGRNTLLHLKLQQNGGLVEVPALLKEVQRHALRGHLLHADFIRVDITKPVLVTVPLVLVGKPEGVKEGGYLHQELRNITVLSLPNKIPNQIEVDVKALNIGDAIHVSDLKLEEGVMVALSAETTLCVVTAPKEDKAETAVVATDAAVVPAATDAKDEKAKTPAKGK